MTSLPFFLLPVLIYAVPAALGLFVIARLMGQKFECDLLLYSLLPITSWLALVLLRDKGKTLSNFVVEPLILAGIVCVLVALHFVIERREILTGRSLEVATSLFSVLITVGFFFLMPALPE
jgi:hypothetical protein